VKDEEQQLKQFIELNNQLNELAATQARDLCAGISCQHAIYLVSAIARIVDERAPTEIAEGAGLSEMAEYVAGTFAESIIDEIENVATETASECEALMGQMIKNKA